MAKLTITSRANGAVYVLADSGATIGRNGSNVVVLADREVSARHARVVRDGNAWSIEDLGSRNGTYVNGVRVTEARLSNGDRIRIGTTGLVLEDSSAAGLVIDESAAGAVEPGSIMTVRSVVGRAEPGDDPWTVLRTIRDAERAGLGARPKTGGESMAEAKLRLIQLVSEKLVRILDAKRLMDEIMSIVTEQTGADRGFLCLLDESRAPVPIASRGLEEGEPMRISRTVLHRLLDEKSGVLIKQTPPAGEVLQSLRAMGVRSSLCAPLWIGDDIIGFLSLDSTTPGKSFTESDLDLLLAIAHQAAVGIERSRLTEKVQKEERVRAYLSKYLDDKIVERITSGSGGADPLAPVERVVTVLFSDIVSFTKISEGLRPAELAGFVREYLTDMTEIIFRHGGTIDKYVGDAVMALFGAPVASPDSPAAAIRAALEMRDHVRSMQPPQKGAAPLRVRFGINTGLLVVGNIGSARRMEYTALGDTVNVAARLQTFARPDEICIDEGTLAKTAGRFAVEEIGTVDVKNRAQPVVVYKVLGEN